MTIIDFVITIYSGIISFLAYIFRIIIIVFFIDGSIRDMLVDKSRLRLA